MKFFYDKMSYVKQRYAILAEECKSRGWQVKDWIHLFEDLPQEVMKDYLPTKTDIKIVTERLEERGALRNFVG